MTTRSRLLLFTIVLVLGAMAAAGMIGYRMGGSSLETSFSERLAQARQTKAAALQSEFENIGKSLLITAELSRTRDSLRDFLRTESETFRWLTKNSNQEEWRDQLIRAYSPSEDSDLAKAIHHLHKFPLFLQAQFIKQSLLEDIPTKSVVSVPTRSGLSFFRLHESVHPFFLDYADRFGINDILLVDNTGTIVYTLQKGLNFGTNLNSGIFASSSLGDAYRWSLNATPRSFKFFDFTPATFADQPPPAYFVSPVFDKSQYLGAVIFQISLDRIDQILSDSHQWKKSGLKETGEVLAVGPEGLFRNNSRFFFENPVGFLNKFKKAGGSEQVAKSIEDAKTTALKLGLPIEKVRHYFRTDETVESDKDYLGQESLASAGKVHLPGGGDWVLIAKIDRDEAVAPLSQYLVLFGLGTFVLLATFIIIFLILSRRLTTPLRSLEVAMSRLMHHDWKQRLHYDQKDEYAKVFENYNQLAENLEQTTEAKEALEAILDTLGELLLTVELITEEDRHQFIVRTANATAGALTGVPKLSLVNSDLKLWIDTNFEKVLREIQSEIPDVTPFEGTLKRISGEKIPLMISLGKANLSSSTAKEFLLIASDISQQKEVERQLLDKENLLRDSQSLANTGIFRWEPKTGKAFWTDQLYKILGLNPQKAEASDNLLKSLIFTEDLPLLENAYQEAQNTLKPYKVDFRIRRADTHELAWLRAIGQIEYDQYGLPALTSGVMQDVTDLKRTELALISAKDEALKSSQAKSEFLAHMSHEIRTPMNAIMGMAELLRETKLTDDQEYYIKIFCKAGEVLMALINDILDLSKIEAGEVSIENIPFDLVKMMTDIQDMMKPRALEKGLGYSYEIAKGINPQLMGDPNKLRQVLINLVSNSIKFTDRGQIRVMVSKNPTKKDSLMISVSDSGVGIAPSKQHLIFQKFSQADSSITRKYGGTGLGLAISKSLVELMGGQIWFKSREGVGTTFFFTVPQREQIYSVLTQKPVPMQTPALDFKPSEIEKSRDPNKKVRILLADDTEDNRILFTRYLKNGPFEIVEAENGLEAVNKIKSDEFDVVFMDVQMPEMDGYAATEQIREWEKSVHHAHIPIIALTAHALSDDREKSLRAGCDDHITKPFKKNTLLDVIDRYSH